MTGETYVTPDYFAALQIPILMGRSFTDADGPEAQSVAIVNQAFARKFFHGTNPVGRYVNKGTRIVGMVEDVAVVPGLDSTDPLTGEEGMYVPARADSGCQVPRAPACLVSAELDCAHRWPGRWADRPDVTRSVECRSQPPLLRLLQHAGSVGQESGYPACGSGAHEYYGVSGSLAEHSWDLRPGSQRSDAEETRNRAPHGTWLQCQQSNVA